MARYSIGEARNALARIVHEAEEGRPVEITRRGKPVAVLVSLNQFQRARQRTFWDSYERFRREADLEHAGFGAADFEGLRDRRPGRKAPW